MISLYSLTIQVDNGRTNSTTVDISINDIVTQFEHSSYSGNINENAIHGDAVQLNEITSNQLLDAITNPGPAPIFSIIAGGDDKFDINSDTGIITLINGLDYDDTSLYSLTIQVDGIEGTDNAVVNIEITETPEPDPQPEPDPAPEPEPPSTRPPEN